MISQKKRGAAAPQLHAVVEVFLRRTADFVRRKKTLTGGKKNFSRAGRCRAALFPDRLFNFAVAQKMLNRLSKSDG